MSFDANSASENEPIIWESIMPAPPMDEADKFNERLTILFYGLFGLIALRGIMDVKAETLMRLSAVVMLGWAVSFILELLKNGWRISDTGKRQIPYNGIENRHLYSSCQITRSRLNLFNGGGATDDKVNLVPSQIKNADFDYLDGCPALRIDVESVTELSKVYLLGQHNFAEAKAVIQELFIGGAP